MATFSDHFGNIFESAAEAIVITVNTVGVMGAGIALEASYRWPHVDASYQEACRSKLIGPGKCQWLTADTKHVVLFPTKIHWRQPSTIQLVRAGMADLHSEISRREITSIAMPHLGCSHGGLSWTSVRPIVVESLETISDLAVELWEFDPRFHDPLFARFREYFTSLSEDSAMSWTSMSRASVRTVTRALEDRNIVNFLLFRQTRGIGRDTANKAYDAARSAASPSIQDSLFDDL